MSTNVVWNGVTYAIPAAGEVNWPSLSNFLIALGTSAAISQEMKQAIRVATTSPVTVSATTDFAVVTQLAAPGAVAVTLPAGIDGQVFVVVDGTGDAASNNITITPNGSATIGGAATQVLNHNSQSVMIQYSASGTDWKVLVNNIKPGTITSADITGTIAPSKGGTGVANNDAATLTRSGNHALTVTTTGSTNVTLPTTGTLVATPVVISDGGTGQTSKTPAFDALAPTTTKGDLIAYDGSDNIRVGVGTDGFALVASSVAASGLAYAAVLTNPMTTTGDVIYSSSGSTPARLAIGKISTALSGGGSIPAYGYNPSNVAVAQGAGTTGFDLDNPNFQVFNLTASRTCTLPTTGVPQGYRITVETQHTDSAFILTIQSSGANTITTLRSTGRVVLTANQATPTTAAHWIVSGATEYGTYTPTITNGTNVASSTPYATNYFRVGTMVNVSGRVDIDVTSAIASNYQIALPIASNFTASDGNDCNGISNTGTGVEAGQISSDSATDRARVDFVATTTTNRDNRFIFTYIIK